jgi:aminopeptidase N
MLSVQTAVPTLDTKEEAWTRMHGDGYGSLQLDRAAMAGFNWASQADLLAPYVRRFFEGLEVIFETREHEAAKAYFSALAPSYRVDDPAIGLARGTLDGIDGPPQLQRLLIELVARQERALAARRFADS